MDIISLTEAYFCKSTRKKIIVHSERILNPKFIGGIEKDFDTLIKQIIKSGQYDVLHITGHNDQEFNRYKYIEKSDHYHVIYCINQIAKLELLLELSNKSLINSILWGDIWGLEIKNDETYSAYKLLIKLIKRVSIIWCVFSLDTFDPANYPWNINKNDFKAFLKYIDTFVVISVTSRGILHNLGIELSKIKLIYPPIDTSLFAPIVNLNSKIEIKKKLQIPVNSNLILFSGRFISGKGSTWLIKNWRIITEECDFPLYLAMVGNPYPIYAKSEEWLELKNRIQAMNTNIYFTNKFVHDSSELALWYKAADIFIFPSILNEGLGVSLLKAVAAGLPSICTEFAYHHTPVKELIKLKKTGELISDITPLNYRYTNQTQSTIEAIDKILSNFQTYQENTINFAKTNPAIQSIEKTTSTYLKLLDKSLDT